MRFGMPQNFWLLALVPLLVLLLVWAFAHKRRALERFASAAMVPRLTESVAWGRQYGKAALWVLGVLWLGLALTGPQFGAKLAMAQRRGIDVMVVLDASRSMLVEDVKPNRLERAKLQIRRLLDLARASGFPVVYTTVVYREGQLRDGAWFVKKVPALAALMPDTKEVQIVPEIAPQPGELVLEKCFPSGFYGTNLHSYLTYCGVDTVVVTGNSTSGCVRATVIDAVSAGFRVIVPRQCVADRVRLAHLVNLFDIDSKYGDVMEIEDVVAALQRLVDLT